MNEKNETVLFEMKNTEKIETIFLTIKIYSKTIFQIHYYRSCYIQNLLILIL